MVKRLRSYPVWIGRLIFYCMVSRVIMLKIVKYLFLLVLGLMGTGLILFLSSYVADYFGKDQWDSLAFTGAIVGGSITLIGVRIAIRNQDKSEFLNSYPLKMKQADDIAQDISEMLRVVKDFTEERPTHIIDNIRSFIKNKDELMLKAANVNHDFYRTTRHFYEYIDQCNQIFHDVEIDDQKIRVERIVECNTILCRLAEAFDDHRHKLLRTYYIYGGR
jgi:uncharacterized membrane protein YgaE (UPF0421/DUF939 family)